MNMEVKEDFRCTRCDKTFAADIHLQKHIYLHDQKQCKFCDNWFSTHFLMLKHMAATHGDTSVRSECFRCEHCGSYFIDTKLLRKHIVKAHSDSKYICKTCSASFDESAKLTVHELQCMEEKHVQEKPFRCDICHKRYGRYEYLYKHRKIHSNQRPFKCDECGRTFVLKEQLKRHEKQHSIEKGEIIEEMLQKKVFKCDFCPKTCSTYGNLLDHRRVHTKEKPFKCLICSKSFARQGALKVHTRIHTGERPFECQFCSMTFYHISHRGRHEKQFHSAKKEGDDVASEQSSSVADDVAPKQTSSVAAGDEPEPKKSFRDNTKKLIQKPPNLKKDNQYKFTLEIFKTSESIYKRQKKD